MATVQFSAKASAPGTYPLTANDTIELGINSLSSPSTWTIYVDKGTLDAMSVTVTARVSGTAMTRIAIPYRLRTAAGNDTQTAGTAIAASSLIEVNSTGLDVAVVVAGSASGAGTLYVSARDGSAR